MAYPGFPMLQPTRLSFKLGPGHLCTTCHDTPLSGLPFEDEDAYPHHLSLGALEKSGANCAMCALLYWAAGCSLVDYGGMGACVPINLSSGAQAIAMSTESIFNKFGRALENGGMMVDFSKPVADYRPPIQVDLKMTFPNGTVMKNGQAKAVRPWLFVSWYKSSFVGAKQLWMVGLGVRLGTSGKIEDAVDYDGDTVKLRGTYLRFRTDQDVDFIPGRIRAEDSGSSYAFDKLKSWISICDEGHDCVSLNTPSKLPTRVLDVATQQNMIFLRETAGQKGNYVALSHSWGSTHRLTLKRANMAILMGGILLSDIPRTFQDAVQIARELKIAYLWIDSLCIVQDDASDWEVEASRMGDVYAGSYLTVAALSSQDDSSGCFPDASTRYSDPFVSSDVSSTGRRSFFHAAPVARWDEEYAGRPTLSGRCVWGTDEVTNSDGSHMSWLYVTPEWMPPSVKKNPKSYLLGEFGGSHDPIADEVLSKRGWTLQERLLAPRTIHYGRTEMYWECQKCVVAEDGALLRREFTTINDLCGPTLRETDRHWGWARLVEQYSTRKLTMASDKLPALSGLAHMIATKTSDTYLAGLWKSNLLSELNWVVKAYEPTHQCSDPEHDAAMPPATKSAVTYPAEYRAPSWSWASLDAEIEYRTLSDTLLTTCIDVKVQPVGKDHFGRVASGRLKLKGPVYSLYPRKFKGREGVIHPLQVGVTAIWSSRKKKLFKRREKEVSKEGIANFDNKPEFPSVALFLDTTSALILKAGPRGACFRVGRATFSSGTVDFDSVHMPDGAVTEITIE